MDNILVTGAGLAGFAGVAIGAAASHLAAGDPAAHGLFDIASRYLLIHAVAVLAATILARIGSERAARLARIAASLMLVGAAAFAGGISLHAASGHAVIDPIIPAGGVTMMLGWLVLAASGAGFARHPRS